MFCTKSCTMKRVIQNSCAYFSAIEKLHIINKCVFHSYREIKHGVYDKRQKARWNFLFAKTRRKLIYFSSFLFRYVDITRNFSKEWDRLKNVNFQGFMTRSCLQCLPIAVNVMLNLSYITRTGTQTWMCPLYSWIIFLIKLQRWVRTRHNTWFMQIGDLFLKDFSRTNIFLSRSCFPHSLTYRYVRNSASMKCTR